MIWMDEDLGALSVGEGIKGVITCQGALNARNSLETQRFVFIFHLDKKTLPTSKFSSLLSLSNSIKFKPKNL